MKKIFGILMAVAVIATASTVVASATNNEVPALPDTGTTEKDTTTPEVTTTEEGSKQCCPYSFPSV